MLRLRGIKMDDPTYIKQEIDANPLWKLAFRLSEMFNDNAPIGWGSYILLAKWLFDNYTLIEKEK